MCEQCKPEIQLMALCDKNIKFCIITSDDDAKELYDEITYLPQNTFLDICHLYEYPLSIISQKNYTDKLYRDAYYHYFSHLHFDMERQCQRLALFQGKFSFDNFFDSNEYENLQQNFLGTLVIRPSYNKSNECTLGRTLLNPYKMKKPLQYIRTATYTATICGHTYSVQAFPFSNQMWDVLRCAETSIWELMEYFGKRYENYSTILPSTILKWADRELPTRSIPSIGLTYYQISELLKSFHFGPRIYERGAYQEQPCYPNANVQTDFVSREDESLMEIDNPNLQLEIEAEAYAQEVDYIVRSRFTTTFENTYAQDSNTSIGSENKDALSSLRRNSLKKQNVLRTPSFSQLFHYYVESGIPLIAAVDNMQENIYHSIVVIGHDERSPYKMRPNEIRQEAFKYKTKNETDIYFIDSASLYQRYVTMDDNQFPYRRECFDRFSISQNCKVDAFIVPLYRHILLDAESAISIIETVFHDSGDLLLASLEQLNEQSSSETANTIDNPFVLRYYLATSHGFSAFRCKNADFLEEKAFYASTPFPKFVWVGEYSTLELYRENKILGEVVVDATAPKYSGIGAVIAIRLAGRCVARSTGDPPNVLPKKMLEQDSPVGALVYDLYTNNLQKGDLT